MSAPELSLVSTRPVVSPGAGSLSRRLVLGLLAPLREGLLELRLPEGGSRKFGAVERQREGFPPDAVLEVRSEAFFKRCLQYGDIGFAESYLDGEWTTPDLAALLRWLLSNRDYLPGLSGAGRSAPLFNLLSAVNRLSHLLRRNSRANSRKNIAEHYDLSNAFFSLFLDRTMTYSSACWSGQATTLEAAQEAKYERLSRQLRLHEGDHLLEIGSGWGGMAEHAARRYGCRVTAVTVSQAQYDYARERMEREGLSDLVEVRLCDYRDLQGRFTKIVSIEMLEAVGHAFLETFCETCDRVLAPGGIMALQFITCPDHRYDDLRRGVDYIQKHIFPGSLLLSQNRLHGLLQQNGGFVIHDLKDLGHDYALTLREWRRRFNERVDEVTSLGFDERFLRKWNYYLCYCEAAFETRNISVVQGVYTRPNNRSLDQVAKTRSAS